MQNQAIQELVVNFARNNKYSRVKIEGLLDELINLLPAVNSKRTSSGVLGRSVSEKSQQIRDYIKNLDSNFTSRDIASQFDVSLAFVNNNLRFLNDAGIVEVVDRVSNGGRGKKLCVWNVVNQTI